jgi:hypothetical protein
MTGVPPSDQATGADDPLTDFVTANYTFDGVTKRVVVSGASPAVVGDGRDARNQSACRTVQSVGPRCRFLGLPAVTVRNEWRIPGSRVRGRGSPPCVCQCPPTKRVGSRSRTTRPKIPARTGTASVPLPTRPARARKRRRPLLRLASPRGGDQPDPLHLLGIRVAAERAA